MSSLEPPHNERKGFLLFWGPCTDVVKNLFAIDCISKVALGGGNALPKNYSAIVYQQNSTWLIRLGNIDMEFVHEAGFDTIVV